MSSLGIFGSAPVGPAQETLTARVVTRHPLGRVLAFTGRSIDDVVNDPIVKNEVLGFYKVARFVQRRAEAIDLERQWNPLGLRIL
jgi:hypothetical protein